MRYCYTLNPPVPLPGIKTTANYYTTGPQSWLTWRRRLTEACIHQCPRFSMITHLRRFDQPAESDSVSRNRDLARLVSLRILWPFIISPKVIWRDLPLHNPRRSQFWELDWTFQVFFQIEILKSCTKLDGLRGTRVHGPAYSDTSNAAYRRTCTRT
jgi:hypothetical protein